MNHAGSMAAGAGAANVKASPSSDSPMTAQLSFLSIHELFAEEVESWITGQRSARGGASRAMLMQLLAHELGLTSERQVYRYMSGETPLAATQLVRACRVFGSHRLLMLINQEAGLLATAKLDVGSITNFDLVVEQARNLKELGELVAIFAAVTDRIVSEDDVRTMERESREAIQQIDRVVAYFRELLIRQRATA